MNEKPNVQPNCVIHWQWKWLSITCAEVSSSILSWDYSISHSRRKITFLSIQASQIAINCLNSATNDKREWSRFYSNVNSFVWPDDKARFVWLRRMLDDEIDDDNLHTSKSLENCTSIHQIGFSVSSEILTMIFVLWTSKWTRFYPTIIYWFRLNTIKTNATINDEWHLK